MAAGWSSLVAHYTPPLRGRYAHLGALSSAMTPIKHRQTVAMLGDKCRGNTDALHYTRACLPFFAA